MTEKDEQTVLLQRLRSECDEYMHAVKEQLLLIDKLDESADYVVNFIDRKSGKVVAMLTRSGMQGETGVEMVLANRLRNSMYMLLNEF